MVLLKYLFCSCLVVTLCAADTKYKPDWKSLDARPLPQWYDDAKFGIFIHWGVYSVPSFGSEWFWRYIADKSLPYVNFMRKNFKPGFTYQDFARDFTAEFFDPSQWARLFEASGAKYVVLTSKHHEGYTLWPSKYSFGWNAKDVGPHKDLVGELSEAIKKTDLKFGLYHSLFEWFNPLWLKDDKNNFSTNAFVTNKIMPELIELVETYKPEIVWSDGDAHAPNEYWKAKEFMTWLYNESPVRETVVTNDRWGKETACQHGDIYTCADRYNPGILQKHKWENCMTIDRKSWGFRRNALLSDYLTLPDLVKELITTVSCGGNLLMNVGPTKDGIIEPIFEERLRGIGEWLQVNGEAIYKSKPWKVQNDTLTGSVWYTKGHNGDVYASVLTWPVDDIVKLGAIVVTPNLEVTLLGSNEKLIAIEIGGEVPFAAIKLPESAHRGQPAWVLRFKNYEQSMN